MINIVIIGYGRIAANHILAIEKISDAKIVGVCSRSTAKTDEIREKFGCKLYTDADEMLSELCPDAAIICTPTYLHEKYIKICASHNVAVLCEKPLTRTSGSALRALEAVKESGIIFMTAQVVRFWPGYVEIKKMIENKEFGEIYMIRFRRVTSRDDAVADWLNSPKLGGGAIHDMLVHDVDYLRYIAGPFDYCFANATKDESGCYNNVMANIICKNGIHAMAEASFTMQTGYPFSFSISIAGSTATLEYDYHSGIRIADTDKAESSMKIWREGKGIDVIFVEEEDAFLRQMRYFLSCVREKKLPELITPDETYEVIHAIDALHESARSGTVVHIDEYGTYDFKHPPIIE